MGVDRPHEGTVEFGLDSTTRRGCLRIRCSCGWTGPDHELDADTREAVERADELCLHDFRLHLGWRQVNPRWLPNKLGG